MLGGVELEGIVKIFPKESRNNDFEEVSWSKLILNYEIGTLGGNFGSLFRLVCYYYVSSNSLIIGLKIVNSSGYSKIWLYALLW